MRPAFPMLLMILFAVPAQAQVCFNAQVHCRQQQVQYVQKQQAYGQRQVYAQKNVQQYQQHGVYQQAGHYVPQFNQFYGQHSAQYANPFAGYGGAVYGQSVQAYQLPQNLEVAADRREFSRSVAALIEGGVELGKVEAQLLAHESSEKAKLARIVAAGQAAAESIRAASTLGETQSPVVENVATTQPASNVPSILATKCAKCHSGSAPKGGVLLDGSGELTDDIAKSVLAAVQANKMPIDGEGNPHPLSDAEKWLVFQELFFVGEKK